VEDAIKHEYEVIESLQKISPFQQKLNSDGQMEYEHFVGSSLHTSSATPPPPVQPELYLPPPGEDSPIPSSSLEAESALFRAMTQVEALRKSKLEIRLVRVVAT
jgi:hypothetical protein